MIRPSDQLRGKKAATLAAFFLFSLVAGCRSPCEHIESELRSRERELRELREEFERTAGANDAMQRELCELRKTQPPLPPLPPGPEPLPPPKAAPAAVPAAREGTPTSWRDAGKPAVLETVSVPATVKEIALGRGTGGLDEDRMPGDDALQVVVEPRDTDGHAIKVPGCLHVTVLEISPEGTKKPLSSWELSADELRRTWRNGLFSTGYYVTLPWKACPEMEKLRVVVQFQLSDGRLFEADKDVTVRVPPPSVRKPCPSPAPPPYQVEKRVQPISWQQPALNGVRLLRPHAIEN